MKPSILNVYVLLTHELARPKKTAPLSIKMRIINFMKLANEGVCAIYHLCT